MKFTFATIAAVATILPSLTCAHVLFVDPPPYNNNDGTGNFPMAPDGSDFPCTVQNFNVDPSKIPTYQPGSDQAVTLQGSAVHGGGSCQIAFTYDLTPTKGSTFRVVKSFEGGCPVSTPGNLGNDPTMPLPPLPFKVPSDMPAGECTIAWTWFNKIGNREMYMRCARVRIGGSQTSFSKFNQLPEIFKANVGSVGNGCITKEGINIKFPNPGPVVQGTGDAYPDGPGCPAPGSSGPAPVENNPPAQPSPTSASQPVLVASPTPTAVKPPKKNPNQPPANNQPPKPKPAPSQPGTGASCSTDGEIVCTSPTTWGVCDYGHVIPMGQTAAGMECKGGKMVTKQKRAFIRFSADHLRRRHHKVTM